MKAFFLSSLILCSFLFSEVLAQTPGEWTWMKGSNTNMTAVYGVQGVPAAANTPPNPDGAAEWVDLNGNLWFYGGEWVNSTLVNPIAHVQDLWMYNISTNMWTWINGPGTSGNGNPIYGVVGSYGATTIPRGTWSYSHCCKNITWTDLNGDLWMTMYDIGQFQNNNMNTGSSTWKYSIALNQWACMHKGGYSPGVVGVPNPNNSPQPASSSAAWVADDGNLWFYGAFGKMWMFNVTTNTWVIKHGTATASIGVIGVYNPNNRPESDDFQQHWKSDDGTFYMFGGADWTGNANNNMWQYDPTINQWRVVAGQFSSNTATFVQDCVFDPANHPSNMLYEGGCWKGGCNRFFGYDEGSGGYIWCFDPLNNQFAKVSGSLASYGTYIAPSFGTQGVSAPTNSPGSFPIQAGTWASFNMGGLTPSWTDANGNFWRMGSSEFETNALWRYVPDPLCLGGSLVANFSASTLQGCAPLTVDFTAVNTGTINSFQWDFGDQNLSTDTSSLIAPSFTFNDAGVYSVQLIVEGLPGCSSATTDTMEMLITVVDVPQLTLTDDTTVCLGSSVTLNAGGATDYVWSPSSSLSATTGNSVSATPITETTYYVIGENSGCYATDSVKISLAAPPVINISDTIICLGDATVLNVTGADTYVWSPATGLSATTGATVVANPAATTTYTITGTDLTSTCTTSEQMTVSIEQVNVTVNSDTLCFSNPLDLQAVLTASGGATYEWGPPNDLNTTNGSTVIASPPQTTIYTVVGTTLLGCSDTTEAIVTVIPAFDVTVNSGDICEGEELLLIANGAENYTWYPVIGLSGNTGPEVLSSPATTTSYSVVGSVNGCLDTAYAIVTVHPDPSAIISVTPNPVSSIDPSIVVSTPTSNNTVEWQLDGSFLSNLESFTHVLPEGVPGSYVLQLISTNALGCADTAWLILEVEEDFVFYVPNAFTPDGDAINATFQPVITDGIDASQYTFEIYDRWGERIFTSHDLDKGWDGTYKGLLCPTGVYTWTLVFTEDNSAKTHQITGHVALLK